MPTKTTKKASVKATATKKTVKKSTTKTAKPVMAPVHEMHAHDCGCAHDCGHTQFSAPCMCGGDCHCHKHGGSFFKKFITALILLALGFAAGMVCHCPRKGMRGPRVEFAPNGCMIEESVKCPKLRESLASMDINQDGCITREEFRAVKHKMRKEIRDIPTQEVDAEPAVAE